MSSPKNLLMIIPKNLLMMSTSASGFAAQHSMFYPWRWGNTKRLDTAGQSGHSECRF